ncbi:hypothetical protein [uncultured Helicobacter sp.]
MQDTRILGKPDVESKVTLDSKKLLYECEVERMAIYSPRVMGKSI